MIGKAARKARRLGARAVAWRREPPLPAGHQPIFVLGHQKSGTSAIAALLGEYAGVEATIDLHQEIRDLIIPRIEAGEAGIEDLIKRNRADFAAPIVKHPNLTLIYPQLRARFPSSRFVFVIRDPRDNLRSVLDRLEISGQATEIGAEEWATVPRPWQLMLGSPDQHPVNSSHLDALCARWNLMAAQYLEHDGEMDLIRYEDFLADKTGSIAELAATLNLSGRHDIAASVDRPFQPRGANRDMDVAAFFGSHLERIESACAANMERFGYPPRAGAHG